MHIRAPGIELQSGDDVDWIEVEPVDRDEAQIENFAAAVRGDEEPLLGRAESVNQARSLAALRRSAAEDRLPVRPGSR